MVIESFICPKCGKPGKRATLRMCCERCHKDQCNELNKQRRRKISGVEPKPKGKDSNEIREEKLHIPYAKLAGKIPWSISIASDYSMKPIRVGV